MTIELRAPTPKHLAAYHEVFSDPITHAYIIEEGVQDSAGSLRKLETLIKLNGHSKKVHSLINDEQAVGFIVIHLDESQSPFISYAIKRSAQRRGFATIALARLVEVEANNFKGLKAATHLSNLPSQRLLRKCGFIERGVQNLSMGERLVFEIML